ncbi:MAG: glycoside hydrolase family 127 protein [Limnochordales bacterium]|nr:glycoside hydrolase family 127 protein [Limnochordales bacterium]
MADRLAHVAVVRLPAQGSNPFYIGNRPPLLPNPLIKLPVGSIRPEGWLRFQLAAAAAGMVGRLEEISPWCNFERSAWADPQGRGEYGWEELPYWLRGFTSLGYVLGDDRLIDRARRWIEAILASQRPDGYFGPQSNREGPMIDVWPNMIALYALRLHYEATGDPRVLSLMERYFRWQLGLRREEFLPGSWQKIRGGDNLDSIYWLYNRTGHPWLLELARINHEQTADWFGGIPSWHGVNICQGFREPAQYYQQVHDPRYLEATARNYRTVMELYGQVPGGMFGADENARPGFSGPRQAAETCSMAEFMWSHQLLTSITGDVTWADRCEEIAFNSLPAAFTPDLKALHYLTAPNMIQLDRTSKAPLLENGGDMLSYSPFEQYRCCQHNAGFAWPYFAEHLWMATRDAGLAAVLYAPCTVTARVGAGADGAGGGAEVTWAEETGYPFSEEISFRLVAMSRERVRFTLYLRIPQWCTEPAVVVNGEVQPIGVDGEESLGGSRRWVAVTRDWQRGDRVELRLPMAIAVRRWEKNRRSVSIYRGPLAFSLAIGERWERYGGTDDFPCYEVFPTTPWNYALLLDEGVLQVERDEKAVAAGEQQQLFTPENAPVRLKVRARRVRGWQQEANGLIGEVPESPVDPDAIEPEDEVVTLIPMGCARLRVSAFPEISGSQIVSGKQQ